MLKKVLLACQSNNIYHIHYPTTNLSSGNYAAKTDKMVVNFSFGDAKVAFQSLILNIPTYRLQNLKINMAAMKSNNICVVSMVLHNTKSVIFTALENSTLLVL